ANCSLLSSVHRARTASLDLEIRIQPAMDARPGDQRSFTPAVTERDHHDLPRYIRRVTVPPSMRRPRARLAQVVRTRDVVAVFRRAGFGAHVDIRKRGAGAGSLGDSAPHPLLHQRKGVHRGKGWDVMLFALNAFLLQQVTHAPVEAIAV